jgi:hypothetical protein
MEQDFDIKAELKTILVLSQTANPFGSQAQKDADAAFWSAIKTLDSRSKCGRHPVTVGRFVRLPAKDSYAYYIVTRVTKKSIKLAHIPYGLKYESDSVRDGEADVDVIERTLAWYDTISERFSSMAAFRFTDAGPRGIELVD